MNIFKIIQKKLMNKDVKPSNQTNLVNYDTNSVFLPKVKDLSVSEQQLVKKYMSEIDLTNLESLITYSKEINNKLSLNTNLVIEYLADLEKEINSIKLIKENEKLLEKEIELLILQSKITLVNQRLTTIYQEIFLRTIALSEIEKKQNSIFYEFLGIFGEANRIKHKTMQKSLKDSVEKLKIMIITMEMQRKSIDNTTNSLLQLIDTLEINSLFSKIINESHIKRYSIYKEKINQLEKIFNLILNEELPDKQRVYWLINGELQEENELINRLAVIENLVDRYVCENQANLAVHIENIKKIEITKERKNEILKDLEKYELIFGLYRKQISEEDIRLLYEKKFYTQVIDFDEYDFNDFKRIKKLKDARMINPLISITNQKEMAIYEDIFYREYHTFLANSQNLNNNSTLANYKGFNRLKKYNSIILSYFKASIKNKDFEWYQEPIILQMLLMVNHPELFKNGLTNILINECLGYVGDYEIFEYEKNSFLKPEEDNLLAISDNLVYAIMDAFLDSFGILFDNRTANIYYQTNLFILFFSLLYGKCNHKEAYVFQDDTLMYQPGIKKVVKNAVPSHYHTKQYKNYADLVFIKTIPHFSVLDIKKMKVPDTLQSFEGINLFWRGDRIEEVNVPKGISKIDNNTFKPFRDNHTKSTNLRKIEIEEGVLEIDDFAFSECRLLTEIYLPSTIEKISKKAFSDCYIQRVYYHPKLLDQFGEKYFYKLFEKSDYFIQAIPLEVKKEKIKTKFY